MPELQWPSESLRSAFPFGRRIGTFLERLPKPVMVIASYAILGLVAVFDYRAPRHWRATVYMVIIRGINRQALSSLPHLACI